MGGKVSSQQRGVLWSTKFAKVQTFKKKRNGRKFLHLINGQRSSHGHTSTSKASKRRYHLNLGTGYLMTILIPNASAKCVPFFRSQDGAGTMFFSVFAPAASLRWRWFESGHNCLNTQLPSALPTQELTE